MGIETDTRKEIYIEGKEIQQLTEFFYLGTIGNVRGATVDEYYYQSQNT